MNDETSDKKLYREIRSMCWENEKYIKPMMPQGKRI
jgi:hypothetical protein